MTNVQGKANLVFISDSKTRLLVSFNERLNLSETTFDFSQVRRVQFQSSPSRQWFPNITFAEEFKITNSNEIYFLGELKAATNQESKVIIHTNRLIFGPEAAVQAT